MIEKHHVQPNHKLRHRKTSMALGLLLLLLGGYALVDVAIHSRAGAKKMADLLSRTLQQPVGVQSMALRGGTVYLNGVTLANPPDFPQGNLASVGAIAVAPDWLELVSGRKTLRSLKISGISISLGKNSREAWNHTPLIRALSHRKAGARPADVVIRKLLIERGSLRVDGQTIDGIAAKVEGLSTRGTTAAAVNVTGKMSGGDISLDGSFRLGNNPQAKLMLQAPNLSLGELMPKKPLLDTGGAKARLLLKIGFASGVLVAEGTAEARGMKARFREETTPLSAAGDFALRYDLAADEIAMERCDLRLDRLLHVQVKGRVAQVKEERRFSAEITSSALSLPTMYQWLPSSARHDLSLTGRLLPLNVRIAGDRAHGITKADGRLCLRDGGIGKAGAVLAQDIAADLFLSKTSRGWNLKGKLLQGGSRGRIPLQDADADFAGEFSETFRLLMFQVPKFSARVLDSPFSGSISFLPAASAPLSMEFNIPRIALTMLNPFLGEKARLSSGTAAALFKGSGQSLSDIRGSLRVEIQGSGLLSGNRSFSVGGATTEATVTGIQGKFSVAGRMDITAAELAGERGEGAFSYQLAQREFSLEKGKFRWAETEVEFARLGGLIPRVAKSSSGAVVPVRLDFAGVRCRRGDVEVRDVAGQMDAALHSRSGKGWVDGTADIIAMNIFLNGAGAGTLKSRFRFSDGEAGAELAGTLLGGDFHAAVNFDPFDRSRDAIFNIALKGAHADSMLAAAVAKGTIKVASGRVDCAFNGRYNAKGDVSGAFSASGAGIHVVKGKRSMVSDAGFKGEGELAGATVKITTGSASVGRDVALSFAGELTEAYSAGRTGAVSVNLPTTQVAALLDAFANSLPRQLQEATAGGFLAARSMVRIKGKRLSIDGNVAIADASVQVPAQKLVVSDIRGVVPFSVLWPPPEHVRRDGQHPSRETYPMFVDLIQFGPHRGSLLSVGKIRFGALELSDTIVQMDAEDGLLSMSSLNSTLAEGRVLGRGHLGLGAAGYGGDLLIADLSLRAFCDAFPAIKGHLSGRLDGIVSLEGGGKGMSGLTGFVDLWTRSTKKEKMLVSKDFLQKLAGKKLKGIFFRNDRPYDRGEISAYLEKGFLTFQTLDISHTNFFGVRDLSVSVAPVQNRIAVEHLMNAIKEAASRGKAVKEEGAEAAPETEFKWQE